MDNPKPTNEFTNMDTILEDLDKYNEPYYDVQDDIYYDVNDHDTSSAGSNAVNVPSKVQIEMDINTKLVKEKYPIADVPKYKTLIEVVLEPSGNNTTASGKNTPSDTQNDIQNDGIPSSKITDNEWNQLKDEFISQYLQSEQNTEPNMLGYNVDNNTHPTPSRHTLDQKPFIMSIHDRNLLSGEEYNYDMSNNSGIYPSSSNRDSLSEKKKKNTRYIQRKTVRVPNVLPISI
ncbi:hypothetical protein C923_00705 [Plasmodium falciparum UGT5.1]|uniref:Plasmodium falciparum erythrocyte membrane protein 1 acidic terminal segment domain-containing protein n=1 Tax=Plasmodium falciparum UGT5.1 TaxID=1237627 RepID=W7JUR2_PLAFA|nr:hypothetical protein C923_00705 [Plasmodium falciparum UGT5.1]